MARQTVQEGPPGHGPEGQPFWRSLPRQRHRPRESVCRTTNPTLGAFIWTWLLLPLSWKEYRIF